MKVDKREVEYDPNNSNEAPTPRATVVVIQFHVEITSLTMMFEKKMA